MHRMKHPARFRVVLDPPCAWINAARRPSTGRHRLVRWVRGQQRSSPNDHPPPPTRHVSTGGPENVRSRGKNCAFHEPSGSRQGPGSDWRACVRGRDANGNLRGNRATQVSRQLDLCLAIETMETSLILAQPLLDAPGEFRHGLAAKPLPHGGEGLAELTELVQRLPRLFVEGAQVGHREAVQAQCDRAEACGAREVGTSKGLFALGRGNLWA